MSKVIVEVKTENRKRENFTQKERQKDSPKTQYAPNHLIMAQIKYEYTSDIKMGTFSLNKQ